MQTKQSRAPFGTSMIPFQAPTGRHSTLKAGQKGQRMQGVEVTRSFACHKDVVAVAGCVLHMG